MKPLGKWPLFLLIRPSVRCENRAFRFSQDAISQRLAKALGNVARVPYTQPNQVNVATLRMDQEWSHGNGPRGEIITLPCFAG